MLPVLDEKDIMLSWHITATLLIMCDNISKMLRKFYDSEKWKEGTN